MVIIYYPRKYINNKKLDTAENQIRGKIKTENQTIFTSVNFFLSRSSSLQQINNFNGLYSKHIVNSFY